MSHRPEPRMFWFRGNAVAFGGRITGPQCETLDAQGSAVLPPTGGFASATVGPFNYKNIAAFERATSTVAGRVSEHEDGETHDTQVTVAVEGLNVLDMVTADRVVARLTSTHPRDSGEPKMLPIGSYFENLRIAGIPVEGQPHPELAEPEHGQYAMLCKAWAERFVDARGESTKLGDRNLEPSPPAWMPGESVPIFEDRNLLAPLFPIPDKRTLSAAGAKAYGQTGIHIPGFGTVFIGEYLVSRYSRRLTMLRIELGCPIKGTFICAYEGNNGHWEP